MTQPYPYEGSGVFSPKDLASSIPRKEVSLGGGGKFLLRVLGAMGPVEVHDVTAKAYLDTDFDTTNAFEDEHELGEEIHDWTADDITREDVGEYVVTIGPQLTRARGLLTLVWTYNYNDTPQEHREYLVIRQPMPTYDSLTDDEKSIVEQVQWMFADLFDSTNGGPHLLETFQSHFGPERIAQLMHLAMNRINTFAPPMLDFTLGIGNGKKLPRKFHAFLTTGTYLEVLKHLMRSYVEQPNFVGMGVTYTDRRDYLQRWQTIYQEEKRDYDQMLRMGKREFLPLGGGALIVSGGIYGSGARYFRYGMHAAAARSARMYPYSAVVYVR
jgi:hypothetical protein